MSEQQSAQPTDQRRWFRPVLLVLGLLLPQVLEFGPSLVGAKILLPLDLLALPGIYLPNTPEYRDVHPRFQANLDKVVHYEPARRFAAEELRAGRYPTWQSSGHAGTPFVLPLFSPFTLMYMAVPDPVTLAWMQLVKAVLVGLGTFLFFRFAIGAGFWPAAVGAWAFPLCGYMVFWQGHYISDAATWLPWALFATDRAVRRPTGWGGPGLGLAVGVSALTGVMDVTAQTLLISGLYAIFRQVTDCGWSLRRAALPAGVVVLGWTLGMLLAACQLLPVAAFARTGARIQERGSGQEERPPVGFSALPQAVLPFCHGTHEYLDVPAYTNPLILPESAATAYAGLLTALVAAPLAFADRRHRSAALFWAGVALIGLSWQLDLPGVVDFWRLPGFNLISHNRDTLLTAFAVLAAGVLGLDACAQGVRWRRGFWVPVVILVALGGWSLSRWVSPPDPIATPLEEIRKHPVMAKSKAVEGLQKAEERFSALSLWGAVVCAAGLGWWAAAVWKFGPGPRAYQVLGGAIIAELILTGWGYNTQADPRLYYPPLPLFDRLRNEPAGRIFGVRCLPPNLPGVVHLSDVRGYDAVDPKAYVELLGKACESTAQVRYARTQALLPRIRIQSNDGAVNAPPILSLLGVRSFLFVGYPPPNLRVRDQGDGYFVLVNPAVLPRAFVPQRAEPAPSAEELLTRLGDDRFQPAELAYVEGLATPTPVCRGTATFITDVPDHIEIRVVTDGPGVLILADEWFEGWEAAVNGQPVPVLRANHALRAVEVPAGESAVSFHYHPPAMRTGFRLSGVALGVLVLWMGVCMWMARRTRDETRPPIIPAFKG